MMHGLKRSESSFSSFGEAYISRVDVGQVRGWKRHKKMWMNLLVPEGKIRFVLIDERTKPSSASGAVDLVLDSKDSYFRLTLPPGVWMAFQGLATPFSLLLNIANIEHDPNESDVAPLEQFEIPW